MELRAKFKKTEVGVIPEDWVVRKFSEHFNIYAGGDVPKQSFSKIQSKSHPYPIFANALQNEGLYGYTSERRSKSDSLTITARGFLGYAVYRSQPFFPIVRLLVLEPTGGLDAKFTAYLVNDRVMFPIESTGVPQLTVPQVRKHSVAFPPTEAEQRAIATVLSNVDALLTAQKKLLTKKCDIRQAVMQQLLTGKHRLSGFTGEWEAKRFDEVLFRVNAKEYQIQTSDYQETGDYPVVDQGKVLIVGYSDRADKCFQCPYGGAIVFGDHTCIVKYVDFNFVVGADGTQILIAKKGQSTRFYGFQLEYDGILTTGYNRHFKFLKERMFKTPSLEEQTAIVNILSDMDADIKALEQQRDKTSAIKQGMMQELLTGRIRLV